MSTKSIKLVHTSDVHLDSRYASDVDGDFRNGAERAFAAVVTCALAESAELLLIVGDLFDHNRVGDDDFDFVASQLARVSCPVVLLPGNHDVHDEFSVWHRLEVARAFKHVFVLLDHDGARIDLDDIGAAVWGRAMAEHAPDNAPLRDAPTRRRHL